MFSMLQRSVTDDSFCFYTVYIYVNSRKEIHSVTGYGQRTTLLFSRTCICCIFFH